MKVLLGHCFYRTSAPSGEDFVYHKEKAMLQDNGVEVVSWEKQNDNIGIEGIFKRVKVGLNTTWSYESYYEAEKFIKKYKPDIAHFHNIFPQLSPSVYKACHDNGVPVVQTLHNFRNICPAALLLRDGEPCELCVSQSIFPFSSLRYKCYRNSISATAALAFMISRNRLNGSFKEHVDRYISLTEFAKERFVRGGLPEHKICVKPNFLHFGKDAKEDKEEYVVFVGRLGDEKGIRTLLKAWRSIKNMKLLLLGDGDIRPELEAYSIKNALNVEFKGFLPQEMVIDIVKKAKIQLIPSECYEGFPMSVLEAFACETPVIASRIGSLAEIIEDNETGVLFETKNSEDLSSKVKLLLDDESKRNYLAKNAKHVFHKKYTSKVNYDLLMNVYNSAISEFQNIDKY